MRWPKLLAGLAVASVALAACGTSGGSSQTIKGTIKIGIDLPVSGSDASDGQPTQNGAKLAVKLAGKVCGTSSHSDACFTLASFPLDDAVNGAHDPGQGAKNVAAQFAKDGGTVLNSDLGGFDPGSTNDFKNQINRAKSLGADVIFFGGTTATKGGQIRKQMLGLLDVPYVAGDGISGNQFAKDAGDNANNSYFTVAGPYPQKLSTAQQFNADYKKEYSQDVGAYSAQAYDAASIIIAALARAIDDAGGNMPTRHQVTVHVAKTLY